MPRKNLLQVNKIFLYFMAMYPIDKNSSFIKRIIFYLWRVVCILFLSTLCFQLFMDVVTRNNFDLTEVTDNIINIGLFIAAIIRVVYFYIHQNELRQIVETLECFKTESEIGVYKKTIIKWTKIIKYFSYIWYFNLFFTVEFMAVLPLFFVNKTGRVLPLPAWYPLDKTKTPYYHFFYLYEALTNLFMGYAYANTDLVFICTATLMAGQFQILGCNVKNVFYTALINSGVQKQKVFEFSKTFNNYGVKNIGKNKSFVEYRTEIDDDIQKVMETDTFDNELHLAIANCINHYQQIVSYCQVIEKIFSPVLFPGIIFGLFYLIFTTFCVVITEDINKIFSQVMYMLTSLNQMFVVTFFAQLLTTESEKLNDIIYECPWYLGNKKFKNIYIIFKHNIRNPVVLTAGPFFTMSLQTFLFILKTTSSYLAVLRQIVDRK